MANSSTYKSFIGSSEINKVPQTHESDNWELKSGQRLESVQNKSTSKSRFTNLWFQLFIHSTKSYNIVWVLKKAVDYKHVQQLYLSLIDAFPKCWFPFVKSYYYLSTVGSTVGAGFGRGLGESTERLHEGAGVSPGFTLWQPAGRYDPLLYLPFL